MKFIVQIHNNNHTWVLTTNLGDIIASASTVYQNIEQTQDAINEFKKWVNMAPVSVVSHIQEKDWKQKAKDQLKKTPWTKG